MKIKELFKIDVCFVAETVTKENTGSGISEQKVTNVRNENFASKETFQNAQLMIDHLFRNGLTDATTDEHVNPGDVRSITIERSWEIMQ